MRDRLGDFSGKSSKSKIIKDAGFSVTIFDSDAGHGETYYLGYNADDKQIRIIRKFNFPDFGKE